MPLGKPRSVERPQTCRGITGSWVFVKAFHRRVFGQLRDEIPSTAIDQKKLRLSRYPGYFGQQSAHLAPR
jgi:hypothetical protein